jgi:hypothetical protein
MYNNCVQLYPPYVCQILLLTNKCLPSNVKINSLDHHDDFAFIQVIGAATLIFERKFIRQCATVG